MLQVWWTLWWICCDLSNLAWHHGNLQCSSWLEHSLWIHIRRTTPQATSPKEPVQKYDKFTNAHHDNRWKSLFKQLSRRNIHVIYVLGVTVDVLHDDGHFNLILIVYADQSALHICSSQQRWKGSRLPRWTPSILNGVYTCSENMTTPGILASKLLQKYSKHTCK